MEISKKGKIIEFIIALLFVFIGVVFRFLPHPPNFAPIAAIALFGGAYLSRKIALLVPLAAMVISDIFLGTYNIAVMASVYGSFLLMVVLGFWLKRHKKWYTIGASAVVAAVLFYLVTNFAVWAFTPWYPKNIAGLVQCYFLALPFFKNTLLGNLFYVTVFFGVFEAVEVWVKKRYKVYESLYYAKTAKTQKNLI